MAITQENASALATRRWKQATERVAAEVTAEMRGYFPDVNTPQDAYSKVVAKQAVALLDSDKPRLDDADKLGQIMGLRPSAWDMRQDQPTQTQRIEYGIDAETRGLLLEVLEVRRGLVLDAETVDAADSDETSPTPIPTTSR